MGKVSFRVACVTFILDRSGMDCFRTHKRTHTTFDHALEFFIVRPQVPMGDYTRWGIWEPTITHMQSHKVALISLSVLEWHLLGVKKSLSHAQIGIP